MHRPTGRSESMLTALIRDEARAKDGSQAAFTERLGFDSSTLSRWKAGNFTPSGILLDRLAEETGKSVEALEKLDGISVEDACEAALYDDPAERDIRERFVKLVETGGENIPVAAYVTYFKGNAETRSVLVDVLEQVDLSGNGTMQQGS